jgi:hypothetical protein
MQWAIAGDEGPPDSAAGAVAVATEWPASSTPFYQLSYVPHTGRPSAGGSVVPGRHDPGEYRPRRGRWLPGSTTLWEPSRCRSAPRSTRPVQRWRPTSRDLPEHQISTADAHREAGVTDADNSPGRPSRSPVTPATIHPAFDTALRRRLPSLAAGHVTGVDDASPALRGTVIARSAVRLLTPYAT